MLCDKITTFLITKVFVMKCRMQNDECRIKVSRSDGIDRSAERIPLECLLLFIKGRWVAKQLGGDKISLLLYIPSVSRSADSSP